MIAGVIMLDRIGKGIRTAPRDALISLRSPASGLATAFGVHRAMDAAGAMLGPVLAFALLALMPQRFDVLFVASFGVAILGLGAIALFVPAQAAGERDVVAATEPSRPTVHVRCPRCRTPDMACAKAPSLRTALQLLAEGRFRGLVLCGGLLGLVTISDSFIYLILQKRLGITLTVFPLLYVGTSLFTSLFAIPCGRLADRIGRTRVLLGGYALLALVYAALLLPTGGGMLLVLAVMFSLGLFYAATDGVLAAMAAAVLPKAQLGSGLAVVATATSLARLAASVAYGFLWVRGGIPLATGCYLVPAVTYAWFILKRPALHGS
jgi:MFS family permease